MSVSAWQCLPCLLLLQPYLFRGVPCVRIWKKKPETSITDNVQKKAHDMKTMTKDTMGSLRLDKCIYDYFVKKGMHETAEAFANETDVGNPTDDGNKCIYDYLVKKGVPETAEAFASEADVKNPTTDAVESPEICLTEWWDMFYDMFSSNQAAQDSYAEAVHTMDNVVPQVPYAVPASSAHSATPVHNISPVVLAFSPERSQEQCYPRTPEDEVTSNLRFLEMDRPIQRSPFVTDPSRLMEQIPYMPQQWDARMEPNADTTTRKAMLPVPEPSEAGSSTGSCFGMKRIL